MNSTNYADESSTLTPPKTAKLTSTLSLAYLPITMKVKLPLTIWPYSGSLVEPRSVRDYVKKNLSKRYEDYKNSIVRILILSSTVMNECAVLTIRVVLSLADSPPRKRSSG